MLYTQDNPLYDKDKEVIKLTIKTNTEHYPTFPTEVFVSEFNFDTVIPKLMGLDISVKNALNLSDAEYYKTWIAFGVVAEHTTDPDYFGMYGNTLEFTWL